MDWQGWGFAHGYQGTLHHPKSNLSKRKEKKKKIHILDVFFSTRAILIRITPNIISGAEGRVFVVIREVTVLVPRCTSVLDECEGLSCKVLSRVGQSCIGVEVLQRVPKPM
jgi:hypothetical protein